MRKEAMEGDVDEVLEIERKEEIGLRRKHLRVAGQPDRVGAVEADGGLRRLRRGGLCRCWRFRGRAGLVGFAFLLRHGRGLGGPRLRHGRRHALRDAENTLDALAFIAPAVAIGVDPDLQRIEKQDIVATPAAFLESGARGVEPRHEFFEHGADLGIVQRLRVGVGRQRHHHRRPHGPGLRRNETMAIEILREAFDGEARSIIPCPNAASGSDAARSGASFSSPSAKLPP
jgi:hypothetical protein